MVVNRLNVDRFKYIPLGAGGSWTYWRLTPFIRAANPYRAAAFIENYQL